MRIHRKKMANVAKTAMLSIVCMIMALPLGSQACSSCGCTLSSEWQSQGISVSPGFKLDVRYDFIDQAQYRTGTGTVNLADYPLPANREIERSTVNRYTTVGLDYSSGERWGVNVQVPYINRSHATVSEGDVDESSSHTSSLGDIRLLARYQGFSELNNFGIQFGLKLPTGAHDQVFNAGPEAGTLLDRGLQPGTGSTDVLLGVYKFDALNQNWDYFSQALIQTPVATQDNYRPGSALNLNLGVRYMALGNMQPQLQINMRTVARDRGEQADTANSGGTLAYLSPGLTLALNKQARLYGFVQLPVYQQVLGLQLAPRWTASIGANFSF